MKILPDGDPADEARVELTPLIDVVFQLLIFFMVTMSFVKNREYLLPVDLAEVTMGKERQDNQFRGMTITVMPDDKVIVDGQESLSDADMETALQELFQNNRGARILLRGDEKATHGRVLDILDTVKRIGFDRVDMVVTRMTS